jgi:uncharacterized protein (TIGR02145 family)
MKNYICLIAILTFVLFSCKKNNDLVIESPLPLAITVTDADGNTYNTVKIGNQIWMKENLKTTKYNDGTPITKYSHAIHGINWLNLNTPTSFYQWADTNNLNSVLPNKPPFDYYGAMYNHLAIVSGKLAPTGWRIPTEQDFIILKNHLTANGHAGKEALALKSNSGWKTSSGNGTDALGFRGLPNGYVNAFGGSTAAELICTWATTDFNLATKMRRMVNLYKNDTISIQNTAYQLGAGIRCIKE